MVASTSSVPYLVLGGIFLVLVTPFVVIGVLGWSLSRPEPLDHPYGGWPTGRPGPFPDGDVQIYSCRIRRARDHSLDALFGQAGYGVLTLTPMDLIWRSAHHSTGWTAPVASITVVLIRQPPWPFRYPGGWDFRHGLLIIIDRSGEWVLRVDDRPMPRVPVDGGFGSRSEQEVRRDLTAQHLAACLQERGAHSVTVDWQLGI